MSAPFANVYYKRAVGTARACYICNKPTTTVLSTQPVVDFIYACDAHLSDSGFATLQAPAASPTPTPTPSASAEEIAKIKAEWEAKQKKKEQAEKGKKEAEEKKDGEKKSEEKPDGEKDKVSPKPISPAPVASGSTTPKHGKYVLHRQFYTMRLTEHRRRRQQKEVDAMAPKLTGASLSVPKQMG